MSIDLKYFTLHTFDIVLIGVGAVLMIVLGIFFLIARQKKKKKEKKAKKNK